MQCGQSVYPDGGSKTKGPLRGLSHYYCVNVERGLHHSIHTAHSTHATAAAGRCFVLRQFSDHGFGGDHQTRDAGGILQCGTRHLGWVEDAHL